MGVSKKWWYPQIIHFNRVFHYKPSIFGVPLFSETSIYKWYISGKKLQNWVIIYHRSHLLREPGNSIDR